MAGQGRTPVDQIHAQAYPSDRDAFWARIRALRTFTAADLVATTGQLDAANRYLRALEAGGVVAREESPRKGGRFQARRWRLVRDCGVQAPRLRADGSEVTQGRAREQIWRAMQILRDFSTMDLVVSGSTSRVAVTETDAERYISRLHRVGYLVCTRKAGPGRLARYKLPRQRNTGPRAPQVQRDGSIFDPNLGRVVTREARRHG